MRARICAAILKVLGWKIEGRYPYEEKKLMLIVMPHTSNWDFPLGLLVRCALRINGSFVGKDSLFKPPHGFLFRLLGGIPVDRSKSNNFVQSVVDEYKRREELTIVIAPEGTRKKVDQLKTGFYYIAEGARIPILMCKFDFENKVVGWAPPFLPTEDKEADFQRIRDYYLGVKGYHPELGYLS